MSWTMKETGLRVREALDRWFTPVVALLVLVAAAGLWVGYGAHGTTETTTVERTVETGQVTGSFAHGANIMGETNATGFESGARVENRTVYLGAIMPVLDGAFALGYEGETPAEVRVARTVEVRSVSTETGGEPIVYWDRTLSGETTTTTLESGDRTRVPFRVDVTETASDAENVSERLRSPGGVELRVVVDVALSRADRSTRDLSYNLTVDLGGGGGVYRVESSDGTTTFERTETVTRQVEPGALQAVGGPALGLVGLAGVAGLAVARRRGEIALSERERAWLDYRDDRDDFDEWITTVRLPEESWSLPVAEAATLADLVDFAIDTDNAVTESPDERVFNVVHDGYRYTYTAPAPPATAEASSLRRAEPEPDPTVVSDPESED